MTRISSKSVRGDNGGLPPGTAKVLARRISSVLFYVALATYPPLMYFAQTRGGRGGGSGGTVGAEGLSAPANVSAVTDDAEYISPGRQALLRHDSPSVGEEAAARGGGVESAAAPAVGSSTGPKRWTHVADDEKTGGDGGKPAAEAGETGRYKNENRADELGSEKSGGGRRGVNKQRDGDILESDDGKGEKNGGKGKNKKAGPMPRPRTRPGEVIVTPGVRKNGHRVRGGGRITGLTAKERWWGRMREKH